MTPQEFKTHCLALMEKRKGPPLLSWNEAVAQAEVPMEWRSIVVMTCFWGYKEIETWFTIFDP